MTNRREFLLTSASLSLGLAALGRPGWADLPVAGQDGQPWLLKTLKIGMVGVQGSLADRFRAAQAAGFDGIELNAPGFDVDEAKAASEEAGLPIDGTVNATHWKIRHTDPDPAQRARALESLQEGIRATAAVGGDTILLVAGHGQDGEPAEIFDRAVENIRPALPLAAELGVKIAIENVWNQFLYTHNGPADQTAEMHARFVDAFDSPWVGMQYDIGNHWKYGDPAAWIRTLGKRIIKLDAKGFSRADDRFTKIGEGDLPWASVREALQAIGFQGWVAAEVGGGGPDRLAEISQNLDEHLVQK